MFNFKYSILRLISFLIISTCTLSVLAASEEITHFDSRMYIQKNGDIDITETITIKSAGVQIKHGIVREFPTHYQDAYGNNVNVDFTIVLITLNGKSVPYKVISAANGKIIKIGNPDLRLPQGTHKFTIRYTTNRQLRLGYPEINNPHKKIDELYWNVTGNGWRLPIGQATASIYFPEKITPADITQDGYTGALGEKLKNFEAHINADGSAHFTTTKPLLPYQGFTIDIMWPAGIITPPSIPTQIWFFFKDNLSLLWLLFGLFGLLAMYIRIYLKARKTKQAGIIIPLFEPPHNMSPGMVRFLANKSYDTKVFASEIVNMAVHGWLIIDYKSGWLGNSEYTLIKTEHEPTLPHSLYKEIADILFASGPRLGLNKHTAPTIERAQARYILKQKLDYQYIQDNSIYVWSGVIISIIALVGALMLHSGALSIFMLGGIFALIFINIIFAALIKTYTPAGRKLMDQIEGFKLFLSTTETERLKIIGTPPTKTPELYEKYLPYAIALNVEQAWSAQFAPVFERLKSAGHPYQPTWLYVPITRFNINSLGSNLGNSLASSISNYTISSSGTPPGSSTGSGGRGSSGGGGGGGGGGGW